MSKRKKARGDYNDAQPKENNHTNGVWERFVKLIEKRASFALLGVFLLILGSRLFFISNSLWHDDAFAYVYDALQIASGGEPLLMWSAHPLYAFFLALVLKIYHLFTGEWSIILLPNLTTALFSALLVFPIYKISKILFKNHNNQTIYSLLTTIVVLINPVVWRWSVIAMNDIFALFFAMYSIYYFIKFTKTKSEKFIFISSIFLFISSMARMSYGILFVVFFITLLFSKYRNDKKKFIKIFLIWLVTGLLVISSYYFIGGKEGGLSQILSGRSVVPNAQEVFSTFKIIFESVGILLIPFAFISFYYLYKDNRLLFILLFSSSFLTILYFTSWYRNGYFDIERYALLASVILIIVSCYALALKKYLRNIFIAVLLVLAFLTVKGLNNPVKYYTTHLDDGGVVGSYITKAGQIATHSLGDGDVVSYQDLSENMDDNAVVFHWGSDWAMPLLLLAGPHLPKQAHLVGIDSKEDLVLKLNEYKGNRIYLLRGARDFYESMADKYTPIKILTIKGRTQIPYIDLPE